MKKLLFGLIVLLLASCGESTYVDRPVRVVGSDEIRQMTVHRMQKVGDTLDVYAGWASRKVKVVVIE